MKKLVYAASLSLLSLSVMAADNPMPNNYTDLTVRVLEINNNQTKFLHGATVYVEPENGSTSRWVRFPVRKTTQNGGVAKIGRVAPSSDVGPYKIVVEHRQCGRLEKNNYRIEGARPKQLTLRFTGPCDPRLKNRQTVSQFDRKKDKGTDVKRTVKATIHQTGGTRGSGLWVSVVDVKGKTLVKKRSRSNGVVGDLTFIDDTAKKNRYRIKVNGYRGGPYLEDLVFVDNKPAEIQVNLD